MSLQTLSTYLHRVAKKVTEVKERVYTTLFHNLDEELLLDAYNRTRKGGAVGVDGQTAGEYTEQLSKNLNGLAQRLKEGKYQAPPVKRVYIPKEGGQRPLGISTFEDKVAQRGVMFLLESIYEGEFHSCSYGFRPRRNAHMALAEVRKCCMKDGMGWILDVDIRSYFDRIDHEKLLELIRIKVNDGNVIRLIGKWLNAGVLTGEGIMHPETGTPQGGVISPLLANIFLHYVLDDWYKKIVKPRMKGRSFLVRYADDFILGFECESDARRVAEVLPKRLAKYGLEINQEKTHLRSIGSPGSRGQAESLNFLGFTLYWAKSQKGKWILKMKTAKKRLARSAKAVWQWCEEHRHESYQLQQKRLKQKLFGHYQYFAVCTNYRSVHALFRIARRAWYYWLNRRGGAKLTWDVYERLLTIYPLPVPRILHAL